MRDGTLSVLIRLLTEDLNFSINYSMCKNTYTDYSISEKKVDMFTNDYG